MEQAISSNKASRANGLCYYGKAITTARTADPRFHCITYVPPSVADGKKTNFIVAVHGTTRSSATEFRDEHERTKALDNVKSFFYAELSRLRTCDAP